MAIHLSRDRQKFIRSLVEDGRFRSESEVVDAALRLFEQQVRDQVVEKRRVEALLIEGLDSGESTPLTPEDWDAIEREGSRLITERKARKDR
jgi:antitoxin ParD1/3/4